MGKKTRKGLKKPANTTLINSAIPKEVFLKVLTTPLTPFTPREN